MELVQQINTATLPQHLAIIMDGNGRWAKERGLNRTAGHEEGAKTVRKITSYCSSLGIKGRFFQNFVIGAEVGFRYTFTDNLDGSNPKNDNFETLRFGNLNSNDWYVFTGLTLTYTFGKNPCFCVK